MFLLSILLFYDSCSTYFFFLFCSVVYCYAPKHQGKFLVSENVLIKNKTDSDSEMK